MPRKRQATKRVTAAALKVLHQRVSKLERAVFGNKERIGFVCEAVGERHEQDDFDEDFTPDEVP